MQKNMKEAFIPSQCLLALCLAFLEISDCSLLQSLPVIPPSAMHMPTFWGQYAMQMDATFSIICSVVLFLKQKNQKKGEHEDEK